LAFLPASFSVFSICRSPSIAYRAADEEAGDAGDVADFQVLLGAFFERREKGFGH
jgi:hypothetical protein